MKSVFLVGTRWFGVLGPCNLLIEELIERRYKIFVFGHKDAHYQQFKSNHVELVELNVKRNYYSFLSDLSDILALRKFIKIYKPEFIHSFNPKPALLCYFALLFKNDSNFLIGVTGLGNTFIKAKPFVRKIIEQVMIKASAKAKYIFFQNPDDLNLFIKNLSVNEAKTKLFRSPGVNIDRFSLKSNQLKDTEPFKVLLVARLIWQKGIGDFVEAYKLLKSKGLDQYYEFLLVGELDNSHPDKLTPKEVDKILELGISWVEWTDEIERVYQENNILLFMSKREGGPRAILEASSTGLPTIGSNCIGVKELVIDGETGFLVQSGDIESIVEKLELYRKKPILLQVHGENARLQIGEKYSLENATKAQLEMYE